MDKSNGKWDKLRIFSGAQLKYIAFSSMLMDHVNKALIYPFLSGEGILQRISDVFVKFRLICSSQACFLSQIPIM